MEGKIVSCSVSPYFAEVLERYNFSPTEVFRVGMAVMLADKDDSGYSNEYNITRLQKAKNLLKSLEIKREIEETEALVFVVKNLKAIKKVVKDL